MVDPEGNNDWTRNLYGEGRIVQDQFNNELDNAGKPGLQAAIRNILHSRETAMLLMDSGTGNLAPSGTYDDCDVANGYILTRNGDGNSRVVLCAAVTALNISAVTKCVVASNDGVISVKDKTSVLPTDVIIAIRGSGDNALVDVRNLKTEDDILNVSVGGSMKAELLVPRKIGTDGANKMVIFLKEGDSISTAITALGGHGTIILSPGTYTENVTIADTIIISGIDRNTVVITGDVTITGANAVLENVSVNGEINMNTGAGIRLINSIVVGNVYCASANAVIDHCEITYSGTYSNSEHGIETATGSYIRISSCYITGAFHAGIILGSTNCVAENNIIYNLTSTTTDLYGILVSSSGCAVKGNYISTLSSASYNSYGINSSVGVLIANNTIKSLTIATAAKEAIGISVNVGGSDNFTITGNSIASISCGTSASTTAGIYTNSGRGAISGNFIYSITGGGTGAQMCYGIILTGAGAVEYTSVTGNTIDTVTSNAVAGSSYGINMGSTVACTAVGNTIKGVATGSTISGLTCSGGSENVVVANNAHSQGVTVGGGNDINANNNS
jgi:hypothetical protein